MEALKGMVRRLYADAFSWEAPEAQGKEVRASSSIREHVKTWIAEWDMRMLYPDSAPEIVIDKVDKPDLSEDEDLSRDEPGEDYREDLQPDDLSEGGDLSKEAALDPDPI